MNAFVSIAGGLDGQVFTSMDAVQVSIDKAERVANRYELVSFVIFVWVYRDFSCSML